MASIGVPSLTISGSPSPGFSTVTVSYDIAFSAFDKAADQPYTEIIRLIGDDTGVAGDPAAAAPDDTLLVFTPVTVRASMIVAPATTLKRTITRNVNNATLNEDKLDAPNPDEIRAVVQLTPQMPAPAGPRESNLVALQLV